MTHSKNKLHLYWIVQNSVENQIALFSSNNEFAQNSVKIKLHYPVSIKLVDIQKCNIIQLSSLCLLSNMMAAEKWRHKKNVSELLNTTMTWIKAQALIILKTGIILMHTSLNAPAKVPLNSVWRVRQKMPRNAANNCSEHSWCHNYLNA